jgi:hypothetical protein
VVSALPLANSGLSRPALADSKQNGRFIKIIHKLRIESVVIDAAICHKRRAAVMDAPAAALAIVARQHRTHPPVFNYQHTF